MGLIVGLLGCILGAQHVSFNEQLWRLRTGIGTGLQCGVLLANSYLNELDVRVLNDLGIRLLWYVRYIDDVCVCIHVDYLNDLLSLLNAWRPEINWELTSSGTQHVPFLDLSLSIVNNKLEWDTHRKPMNPNLYLPQNSCHDESVFSSIVHGEVNRLIATNSTRPALDRQLRFFVQRLSDRGYDKTAVLRDVRNALHLARTRQLHRTRLANASKRKHYIRLQFSRCTNFSCVRRLIHKYKPIIQHLGHVGVGLPVQKSLFRRLFAANWPERWPP